MLRMHVAVLLCLFVQAAVNASQDATTPNELRTDSTPSLIRIEWDLVGDRDHTERADKPLNLFAGSLIFLEPGTTYEVRLDLSDPDGGKATKTVSVATRPIPKLPDDGRMLHVVPGKSGGVGTADDPFQRLPSAQETAKPGNIFLLHGGVFGRRILDGEKDDEIENVPGWFDDNHPNANGVRIIADEEFKIITGLWPERLPTAR